MRKKTAAKAAKLLLIIQAVLAFCALLTACDLSSLSEASSYTFSWDLRGTWVSTDTSFYSGSLIIDTNRITINGYFEGQTPSPGGDDTKRPFRNFSKGVALKGYSEEGKIFISDMGTWKDGIPYNYHAYTSGFTKTERLIFEFGGRQETLEKQ